MNLLTSWARVRRTTAISLLSILGCTSLVDPVLDPRAEPFQPPPVYARWWSMVESCSGLQRSMSSMSWYQVPGSESVDVNGKDVGGYWAPITNRIILGGQLVLDGALVRHEMLHALVRQVKGHSREYFLDRCGGVVSCSSGCVADAGPAPKIDSTVPRVTSDALKLGLSILPDPPSSSIDGGVFAISVTATNPNSYAIVIDSNSNASNDSFFYTLVGPAGGKSSYDGALDPSVRYFAPGETKRHYFDFSIGATLGRGTVPPGIYRVYGGYDIRGVAREGVTIGP